jgi:probable addiction module antidote protein
MKGYARSFEDHTMMELLRDPETAQEYIQSCLEEGVPLQTALRDVIKARGYEKVAKRSRIARPNVIRAVKPTANPTFETMQRLLNSVGLDFSVRPFKAGRGRSRAVTAKAA